MFKKKVFIYFNNIFINEFILIFETYFFMCNNNNNNNNNNNHISVR